MNVNFIGDFSNEAALLREAEDRRRSHDMLTNAASIQQAQLVVANAAYYPNGNPGVLTAGALAGLQPGSPEMDAVVGRQLQTDVAAIEPVKEDKGDWWGWSALKAGARGLFTALNLPIEEVIKHPIRTAVYNYQQGRPWTEIAFPFGTEGHKETGFSQEALAFEAWRQGQSVNLGEGFFPRSTLSPETEAGIAQGQPVSEAMRNPAQRELGAPITQLAREKAQTSVQLTSNKGVQVPVSAGRLAAINVFEPDTFAFNALSGILDVGVEVGLDPTNVAFVGLNKLSKANKVLVGSSARKTFMSRTWDEYLGSADGRNLTEWLAKNQDYNQTYNLLKRTQGTVDAPFAARLTEVTDPGEIQNLIRSAALKEGGRGGFDLRGVALTPQSLLGRALRPGALEGGAVITPNIARMFGPKAAELARVGGLRLATAGRRQTGMLGYFGAEIGTMMMPVRDISRSVGYAREWMQGARFDPEEIAKFSHQLANVGDNNVIGMYRFKKDIDAAFAKRLVDEGYDPDLVLGVTKLTETPDEMRKYFTDLMAQPQYSGPGTRLGPVIGGKETYQPTAVAITEFLTDNIPLIDPRKVRTAMRKVNYSKIRNAAGDKINKLDGFTESVTAIADFSMQKVWKPMVLLRLAWPVRVIGEEQVRMAAAGFDSLFKHPVSYLSWMMAKGKGETGVLGKVLKESAEHNATMSRAMDWLYAARGGTKRKGYQYANEYERLHKINNADRYYGAHAFRLNKAVYDPLQRRLAGVTSPDMLDDVKAAFKTGDLKEYRDVLIEGGKDSVEHARWASLVDDAAADEHVEFMWAYVHSVTGGKGKLRQPDGTWRDFFGKTVDPPPGYRSPAELDELYEQTARGVADFEDIISKNEFLRNAATPGTPEYELGMAKFAGQVDRDIAKKYIDEVFEPSVRGQTAIPSSPATMGSHVYLDELGHPELMGIIAAGPDAKGAIPGFSKAWSEFNDFEDLGAMLKGWYSDALPDYTYGARMLEPNMFSRYDEAINILFTSLMGKPTDKLSRSPMFKQLYWKRAGQLMAYANNDVREKILREAAEAGIERGTLRGWLRGVLKDGDEATMKALEDLAGPGYNLGNILEAPIQGIDDLAHIDDLAKGYALNETKNLLYDLSKRHQFFDITRNIFPFGEAWLEIMTTWSRLMIENPRLIRRMQQGVEGLRRGDPIDALFNAGEYDGKGFFYNDPSTGEEIFNYPGSDLIARWMMDGNQSGTALAALGGGIAGGLAGMAGGAVGAVGGAIAGAATAGAASAAIQGAGIEKAEAQPQFTGRVSGLNLFLGNFLPGVGPVVQIPTSKLGFLEDPDVRWVRDLLIPFGDVDAIDTIQPAWLKKAIVGFGDPDGDDERLYNNTVIDVYKTLLFRGDGSDATPDDMDATLERAKKLAKGIYRIRALSQFIGPTGAAVRFDVRDKDGELWAMQTLASEYYDLLDENNFEHDLAYQEFTKLFGVDPSLLYTAKTRTIKKRSTSEKGAEFEARNAALFDAYPLTAYYARPDDPDDEFDYTAYLLQLENGTRESVSPEQWAELRNDFVGRLVYQHARNQITDPATGKVRSDQAAVVWLRNLRYELEERYEGYNKEVVGVAAKPERADVIDEFTQWANSPGLRETGIGQAVISYTTARSYALAEIEQAGNARSALSTAKKFAYLREWLYGIGNRLVQQHPQFAPAWQQVFYREIEEATDEGPIELLGVTF